MTEGIRALRWELFKVRRFRLTWGLLGLLILVVGLNSALSYKAYQDIRRYASLETRQAPPELRHQRAIQQEMLAVALRANLIMPTSYGGVIGVLYFPGLVLMSVAVAWVVGSEFSWGTLQRQLARGRRRWVMVLSKLMLVLVLAAAGVAAGLLAGSLGGIWTSQLLGAWRPERLTGPVWLDLGVMAVRLWATLSTYGIAAAAAGFAFRSTGLGVATVLFYYLIEALVSGLIVQTQGWLSVIRPYLLSNVTHSLVVEHNPFMASLSGAPEAAARMMRGLEPVHAWVALAAWAALFTGLCFAFFIRRDLQV